MYCRSLAETSTGGSELLPSDSDLFANETTPQYQALEWLSNENEFKDMTLEEVENFDVSNIILERFTLAATYFGLNGPDGENLDYWLLDGVSVCDWNGVDCDDDQHVIELRIGTLS